MAEVVESDGREPGPAGEGLEPDRYPLPGDASAVLAGEDAAGVGSVRPSGEVIGGLRGTPGSERLDDRGGPQLDRPGPGPSSTGRSYEAAGLAFEAYTAATRSSQGDGTASSRVRSPHRVLAGEAGQVRCGLWRSAAV